MASYKYTKEMLTPIVKNSKTYTEVCIAVGIKPATGAQTNLKNRIVEFGINTDHFVGAGWSKGKKLGPKRSLDDYLSNRIPIKSYRLKERLIKEKIKAAKCEICGIVEWNGFKAPLELDHINGNHFDNSLSNLQILCPNCHAHKTNPPK